LCSIVARLQVALLFMFDLSRKSTLTSVKNWYKQARLLNKVGSALSVARR
jgi:GTP-binding protein of the ras superfamily involved in termination of M-phase